MQQFFIDYGLWLLIALLILIGVIFLLAGRKKSVDVAPAEPPVEVDQRDVTPPAAVAAAVAAEPVIVAPVAEPVPVVAPAAPEPAAASPAVVSGAGDDLLKLKGVGPKLNALLIELGVTRYAQIASWSDADIAAIDAKLGNFKGRPVRDQWVDQAKYLAAGDQAGFEAKYGKL
jgi:predicted flap endonuclease-1-like 5' DNA nuclease